MEEDKYSGTTFSPPLWRQRRIFILETLRKHRVTSVLDYGCGEASVLSFLIPPSDSPIQFTKLAGIDICAEVLQEAIERCQPWDMDYRNLREKPLEIDIYHGSVGVPDQRLMNYEAIICSEVIEHLYPDILDKILPVTLGIYQPRVLIVTTPNAEYNINFEDLNYGKPNATMRHDDHKFEWTRQQFQEWCKPGADKYGYKAEFHGIGLLDGKKDDLSLGHCTQCCIFTRLRPSRESSCYQQLGTPHRLLRHIEYPYLKEENLSDDAIFQELEHFIELLCQAESEDDSNTPVNDTATWCTDWLAEDQGPVQEPSPPYITKRYTKVPQRFPVSIVWDIPRVKQICKSAERMIKILSTDPASYEIQDKDITVHKAFEIPCEE